MFPYFSIAVCFQAAHRNIISDVCPFTIKVFCEFIVFFFLQIYYVAIDQITAFVSLMQLGVYGDYRLQN